MGNIEKFDALASKYDTAERCRVAEAIAEQIRRNAHNAADKCAIDYGCGTGLVGLRLLDVFKRIIFIDAAPNMTQMVKEKIDAGHIINADVLPCDLSVDNPPNLKSDYIILAQVLLHIKDVAHILRRLHSVLNDGGHLLIIDFDKNSEIDSEYVHNGFEQEELAAQARMTGFVNIKSSTFYHGNKMFMNEDASLFMLDAVKGDDVKKPLRKRFDGELISLLEAFKWWDKPVDEIQSLIPILSDSNLERVRRKLKEMLGL